MDRRLGVLAFGDSITNGGGELQWGVALQSWALWTARGLGFPYTGCARDGATAHDVVARQIPVFLATAADPEARFDAACSTSASTTCAGPTGTRARTSATCGAAVAFLRQRCERVLVCTLPLGLGRPRAGAERIAAANAALERLEGVLRLRPARLRRAQPGDGRRRASDGLRAGGDRRARTGGARAGRAAHARAPSTLIPGRRRVVNRLRGDATYAYRQAKQAARGVYWRARARRAG